MVEALDELYRRYPRLGVCERDISRAFELLAESFRAGGKALVCGNGGSAADAEHIVGELMKKFCRRRGIDGDVASKLPDGLAAKLEESLPAVSLVSMCGLISAVANDVTWETVFAQQVYGLGVAGDVLIALSTSGNSENCVAAAHVARAKGIKVVTLTGEGGGRLAELADAAIRVPATETFKVQELHLPVYHALCASLESALLGREAPACVRK